MSENNGTASISKPRSYYVRLALAEYEHPELVLRSKVLVVARSLAERDGCDPQRIVSSDVDHAHARIRNKYGAVNKHTCKRAVKEIDIRKSCRKDSYLKPKQDAIPQETPKKVALVVPVPTAKPSTGPATQIDIADLMDLVRLVNRYGAGLVGYIETLEDLR
jgi:hypothetical protein